MNEQKGFSILSNTLNGIFLRQGLFEAQTLSYRLLIMRQYRDTTMPIGNNLNIYNPNNLHYSNLKSIFDNWNNVAIDNVLSDPSDFTLAVKTTVRLKKKKVKRAKKQASRVWREVKKQWNEGNYCGKEKDVFEALQQIHSAFIECYLNVRRRVHPKLYECIPSTLTIIINSKTFLVRDLYQLDENTGYYYLNKAVVSSSSDLRALQFVIAPYFFEKIYNKKRYSKW